MDESSGPSPSSILFARGVIAKLHLWPALRLAVLEGWGGPEGAEKRTWIASVIVDAFEEQNPAPDAEYVEDMLLQIMSDEFETVLEDDSALEIGKDIVKLWTETRTGSSELVLKLETEAEKVKGKKPAVQQDANSEEEDWSDDDDDDDEENEEGDEAPPLMPPQDRTKYEPPEIDEDGFTTVKGKGKSHR
ncbi:hypothetical protein HGRIS_009015 [Hohenbuehelia grisea]|uniref:Pre-rRNA-processing protein TSR2 n=1 Tax=Hohenbuehelia grisea TaxID=104357 RepID=A0ABR3J013_9AGAR